MSEERRQEIRLPSGTIWTASGGTGNRADRRGLMSTRVDAVLFVRFLGVLTICIGLAGASLLATEQRGFETSVKAITFLEYMIIPLSVGSVVLALGEVLNHVKKSSS